jgi:hypothetical protein
MTKDTVTNTRNAIIKDTDHLKRDTGQIIEDVKKHGVAHVDAVRDKANDAFDLSLDFAKKHPLKLATAAFFTGIVIGTIRRK